MVPTPPDGPPSVASVTGRAITLTWNKPKWLDTAIGEGAGYGQDTGHGAAPCQGLCTDPSPLADPNSVTYVVQMQVLGTMQWVVLVTGVQDTTYTVHRLTKGAQYLFRVITATPKTNSKPSPPVGPVQLLDRGERGSGEGRGSWRRGLCPLLGGELPRAGWQGAGKGW